MSVLLRINLYSYHLFRIIIVFGSLFAIIGAGVKIVLACKQRRERQAAIAAYNASTTTV